MTEKEIINLIIDEIWTVTKMLNESPVDMIGKEQAYNAIDSYCRILYVINQKR